MTRAPLLPVVLLAGLAGCAIVRPDRGPTAGQRLETGLAALAAQDFDRAESILEPLAREQWQREEGQQALLALVAGELDARNPDRRLASAADLAARYLNVESAPAWTIPVAESYYLLAEELGAAEQRLARAEARRQEVEAERAETDRALVAAEQGPNGRRLPTTSRESVPSRIRRLISERDELQKAMKLMEERLATREKELKEAQQELERIRKTLRP